MHSKNRLCLYWHIGISLTGNPNICRDICAQRMTNWLRPQASPFTQLFSIINHNNGRTFLDINSILSDCDFRGLWCLRIMLNVVFRSTIHYYKGPSPTTQVDIISIKRYNIRMEHILGWSTTPSSNLI